MGKQEYLERYYTNTNSGLHYDLKLDLNPRKLLVSVAGSLAYHSPQVHIERARFYLHRQFNIQLLEGRRVLGYHFNPLSEQPNPFSPQAAVLDIYFAPPLRKDETALIQFAYQGNLTDLPAESPNTVTRDWTELNRFLPWFPCQPGGSSSDLTFSLRISCPDGYQAASLGRSELLSNSWYFNWAHPTSDIPVVIGRNLSGQVIESESNRVFLSTTTLSKPIATRLGEEALWTLERYSGWFGPTRPNEITLIQSPRQLGGSYTGRGLIVIDNLDEQDFSTYPGAILQFINHAAAHNWWWGAPTTTWEDWLNESFAEFSSLIALRERLGLDIFEKILAEKFERASQMQPLLGFDRSDVSTQVKQEIVNRMLFDKGPLLLHSLAERIGRMRYLELCRARIWSGVADTEHLLNLIAELEGEEVRLWFEKTLKS